MSSWQLYQSFWSMVVYGQAQEDRASNRYKICQYFILPPNDQFSLAEYTCSICDQTFTSKGQFKAHNKIHSSDRPAIACPYEKCCRLYYYRKNLNNHIRSKHQGSKFTCDVCGIGVSSKQKVKEHITKMHMTERKASKRKAQALRKDSGAAKVSVISSLTGVQLGVKAGIQLMKRKPTALLRDQLNEDGYSSFSEDDKAPSLRIQGAWFGIEQIVGCFYWVPSSY